MGAGVEELPTVVAREEPEPRKQSSDEAQSSAGIWFAELKRRRVFRAVIAYGEQQRVNKRYSENTEAYQLYLRGRYFWNKSGGTG